MSDLRIVSYNLDHYDPLGLSEGKYQYKDIDGDRFEVIPEIIEGLNPDVVLVQEVYGRGEREVANSFDVLARNLNMNHTVRGARTVAKSVRQNLANGVLWNDRFQATAWKPQRDFWKPLSVVEGEFEDFPISFASYHAESVGKVEEYGDLRVPEAHKLIRFFANNPELVLGGDTNFLGAVLGNDGEYFDPEPQPEVPLSKTMTPREEAFVLDRGAAGVLLRGGVVDIAARLATMDGQLQECTTGSRPTREGPQRLDRFYALAPMAALACGVRVIKDPLTRIASDHYPILLDMRLPEN